MNWKKSATGKWVATFTRRFSIEPMNCFPSGGRGKLVIRYRLRVDGSAVGGVTPVMFPTVELAKLAAVEILAYGL